MKRIAIIVSIVAFAIACLFGYRYYSWIYHPVSTANSDQEALLLTGETSVDQLVQHMIDKQIIENSKSFGWVAERMSFTDTSIKPGRYVIPPGKSNREIIQMLRLGEQQPVQLIVRASVTLERLAGRLTEQLMIDSTALHDYIVTEYLPASKNFDQASILSLFIPNTYEVYWNISAEKLIDRLEREHDRFWSSNRIALASRNDLEPVEVYTLASIVERETHLDNERAIIAGVYLNRLASDIPLQSDPTVQYAAGDFGIRRVLYKHLEIDSPYNTYKYAGLPPGPIAMPSMASIQAVLEPANHNYLFFCAKPGGGGHLFAETLREHNRNAKQYHSWLDAQGIR